MTPTPRLRVAVVGHVPHVTIARVPSLPAPGDIVHVEAPFWIPGGGGGVAFLQLTRSPAELLFFTAIGGDATGAEVEARLRATGAQIHGARRDAPHSRDLAVVTPEGERTIFVISEPLQPRREDTLPWELLAGCDAVFYTARDPAILAAARGARTLVVTARRAEALVRSGVQADVVVGSGLDPREVGRLADYPVPPRALVMTEGGRGGWIETAQGKQRFPPGVPPATIAGSYGAGDTFAAALTWYVAIGLPVPEACARAGAHGAAVLQGLNPLEHHLRLSYPPDLHSPAGPC